MRVEFEHAIFFGSLSEALSMRRGKESWGKFVCVELLREDDVLHPTRVGYILKPTGRMRQRWEWRDTLKNILGKNRYLVGQAVLQSKKEFVRSISDAEKKALKDSLDFTPEAFWQASRFGERRGPNSIHEFARKLEERTRGYRLNFDPL